MVCFCHILLIFLCEALSIAILLKKHQGNRAAFDLILKYSAFVTVEQHSRQWRKVKITFKSFCYLHPLYFFLCIYFIGFIIDFEHFLSYSLIISLTICTCLYTKVLSLFLYYRISVRLELCFWPPDECKPIICYPCSSASVSNYSWENHLDWFLEKQWAKKGKDAVQSWKISAIIIPCRPIVNIKILICAALKWDKTHFKLEWKTWK